MAPRACWKGYLKLSLMRGKTSTGSLPRVRSGSASTCPNYDGCGACLHDRAREC